MPELGGLSLLEYCIHQRLAVGLITNGSSLDKLTQLLGEKIKLIAFIRVSLDTTSAIQHSLLHRAGKLEFERILGNICKVKELRGVSTTPALGLSFIVDPESKLNFSKAAITDIAAICSRVGADFAQLKHLHTANQIEAEQSMQTIHGWCLESREWGSCEYWVHHYTQPTPDQVCYVPLIEQVVSTGPARYPCCHLYGKPPATFPTEFAPKGAIVENCPSTVCRYVSVNRILQELASRTPSLVTGVRILEESLSIFGYHPYRLFPSAPDLFFPLKCQT